MTTTTQIKLPDKKAEAPKKPFRMTPAIASLLGGSEERPIGLLQLQMARADQLGRAQHYKVKSVKDTKAKLHALEMEGYVQVNDISTDFNRSPYVYLLTKKGVNFLREAGLDVSHAYQPDKDADNQATFIIHTLAFNNVIVSAAYLNKVDPRYCLEQVIHERTFKRKPYNVTWRGETIILIPDSYLIVHCHSSSHAPYAHIILEHENSEKGQVPFRRKIRAYIELLKNKYADNNKGVTVAYTTTRGPHYLNKMCRWTWEELSSTNEPPELGHLFLFTSFDKPTPDNPIDPEKLWLEPVWYSPYNEPP